jgi:hypothetical protein
MAYPRGVQRTLILFGFVLLLAGCSHAAAQPAKPASPVAQLPREPPHVLPTGCRAQPATVYGAEPVVFEIQAPSSTRAEVELSDPSGRSVARDEVTAPGPWRPAQVPSGDFVLKVGPQRFSCQVTVNRELSRASQTQR